MNIPRMGTGWRIVAVSVAALALSAANPRDRARHPTTDTDHEVAAALENVAASLKQREYPSAHDEQCRRGDDNRASDLCAQWKAADAAKSAAEAAWWMGVAGSVIAALTLLVAVRAALWAKKAAIHTEESAVEAKRSADVAETALEKTTEASQTDLRAWVTIDLVLDSCGRTEKSAGICTTVKLKNIGRTPALRVAMSVKAYVRPSIVVGHVDLPELEKFPHELVPLMPQQEFEERWTTFIKQKDIEAGVTASKKSQSEPMIVVDAVVYYHTVFDAEDAPKRLTSVQYFMFSTIRLELRKERMQWLDSYGPAEAAQVKFSRNKNPSVYLT